MFEANPLTLDAFPGAAALLREGRVAAANAMARHYLPQLEPGAPVPAFLPLEGEELNREGIFSAGPSAYSFRLTRGEDGLWLFFQPAPQSAITDSQLSGALGQLRQFMGEFLLHTQDDSPAFRKSYYRMFRLVDNLELLTDVREDGPLPSAPLDLAGLCRQLVLEAAPLLAETGVELRYEEDCPSLLIPGVPGLLRRLILELTANAAKVMEQGVITLRLRRRLGRALLSLTHSGGPANPRQLAALLQQDTDAALPMPGAGAGLGMTVVRRIAQLHGGTLLVEWGNDAPTVILSLPTGPLDPRSPVESPHLQTDGGLQPTLVALADILPARLFAETELD